MKHKSQMSDTFLLGIFLAMVGGFLDAYTYIARGEVFANAQTGNIVLLGMNLAEGHFIEASYYLIPIMAFVMGIIIAETTRKKYKEKESIHWRQIVIIIEIMVLIIVAFIPQGNWNTVANVLVALVSSIQVQSFRKFNGNIFTTTMSTGNLRSGTEHIIRYRHTKDRNLLSRGLQYYGIITFFMIGAALGVWFTNRLDTYSVLVCCILLAVIFSIMFIKEESSKKVA